VLLALVVVKCACVCEIVRSRRPWLGAVGLSDVIAFAESIDGLHKAEIIRRHGLW